VTRTARAARTVLLVALAGASRPAAAAFARAGTCADPQAGYALWWGSRSVTFQLSSAHPPSGCTDLGVAEGLVARSFLTWNQAARAGEPLPCTDFAFVQGPTTASILVGADDGQNVVAFRAGNCASVAPAGHPCHTSGGCGNLFNCWEAGSSAHSPATLAITWIGFDTRTGQIGDADTELNDWDGVHPGSGNGFLYTCWDPGSPACNGNTDPLARTSGCVYIDVGSVVLHESGHVLGLDHPCAGPALCDPPSVMSPFIPPAAFRRALYPEDVEGICGIYPSGQATVRQSLPGSCTHARRGCGCGGGPASAAWALLPPLLLRRRSRSTRARPAPAAPG
jgi:hypothetical protein